MRIRAASVNFLCCAGLTHAFAFNAQKIMIFSDPQLRGINHETAGENIGAGD
jgi:hypothetical protein